MKYRPAFTLAQLERLAHLTQTSEDPQDKAIKKILIPLIAKVEVGAINPAYKLSEAHTIKQAQKARHEAYTLGSMTQEESDAYEAEILGV